MDPIPTTIDVVASRRRPALAIAGFLLVLAPFLFVNPFEVGGRAVSATGVRAWPWEHFADVPFAHAFEVTALFVLGLAAIAAGFGVGGRRLLLGILSVGGFYAIRHHGLSDAYPLLGGETFGLSGYLCLAAILAGALLLRRPTDGTRAAGRRLAAGGGFVAFALAVGCFPRTPPVPDTNTVERFIIQAPKRLDVVLGRGEIERDARRRELSVDVLGVAAPEVFVAIAAAFGVLAAALTRPGAPRRGVACANVSLVALILAWSVPVVGSVILALSASVPAATGDMQWGSIVVLAVSSSVMSAGLGLHVLLGSALARIATEIHETGPSDSRSERARHESIPIARGPRSLDGSERRVARAAFVGATVATLAALWIGFRGETGLLARRSVWDILVGELRWDREHAVLCAIAASLLVTTTGLVRGGGGAFLLVGVATAAVVVEHAVRTLANAPTTTYLGVAIYVPYALAGIAAATSGETSRASRITCNVAAAILLLLLLEPAISLDPDTSRPLLGASYVSLWTHGFAESRSVGEYLFGFLPDHGSPVVVGWLTLVAVTAWLASVRGSTSRALTNASRALFVVAVLWPLIQVAASIPPRARFASPSEASAGPMERAAAMGVFLSLGPAVATFGALVQRRRLPSGLQPYRGT